MHALAYLMLSAALAVPAGDEKEAPKDLDKLQGVWKVTAGTLRGTELLPARFQLPNYSLVVVGDRYVFSTHGGTLTLDPAKRTVDLAITTGRYSGTTLLGRYELKGDTLKLILPATLLRPEGRVPEWKAGEAHPEAVYTLERDGKATKDDAAALLKNRTDALPNRAIGGFGGKGGAVPGKGAFAQPAAATERLLERILERLERIEERLDALEKKLPAREPK
jgi:uncharacterized protein (TIGR03067 family)